MENLINYLKELFTKPLMLWSIADSFVLVVLIIIAISIIAMLVLAICGIVEEIKKHKRGKKK